MNWYFVLKCLISGLVVGIVSELSKRSPGFGAIVASLPLTSILAIIWLYKDTKDVEGVISLSNGIALVVLPSIVFFLILSLLTKVQKSVIPSQYFIKRFRLVRTRRRSPAQRGEVRRKAARRINF